MRLVDIGSSSHIVPVLEFLSFTVDLNALADWLDACGVDAIAMESTSVYWIPLFELLESRGLKVILVNVRHVKNISGLKSDVLDSQWLQKFATYDLLRGVFHLIEPRVQIALSVAPALDTFEKPETAYVAHANGAHTNEHIAHQLHLGRGQRNGIEDSMRHHRRGERWTSIGRDEEYVHPCYR